MGSGRVVMGQRRRVPETGGGDDGGSASERVYGERGAPFCDLRRQTSPKKVPRGP